MAMSKRQPLRQAAESDFLDALEHLSNTFGALDELEPIVPTDGDPVKENSGEGEPASPGDSEDGEGAITQDSESQEGYDGRAVKNAPKP